MYLKTLYPNVTIESVKALVGWGLQVAAHLEEAELPTEEQIQIMRSYDPLGFSLGQKPPREPARVLMIITRRCARLLSPSP